MKLTMDAQCPRCGTLINDSTALYGARKPSRDANSVCLYCAALLKFTDDSGSVRLMSDAEFVELPEYVKARLRTVQGAARALTQTGKGPRRGSA